MQHPETDLSLLMFYWYRCDGNMKTSNIYWMKPNQHEGKIHEEWMSENIGCHGY